MGTSYSQLGLRERLEIEIMQRSGHSGRAIARALQRSPGTISRELQRNSRPTKQWRGAYDGERAHSLSERRRRWDARHKLARQPVLRALVRDCLAMGWSPEQIAGRLARRQPGMAISHESIYRFIYHRSAQKDYWHKLLPRAKHRRGRMRRGGVSPLQAIQHRVPLAQRPREAAGRTVAGHWETDLMLFSRYGQAVLVTHERSSRWLCVERLPGKGAQGVGDRLLAQIQALPAGLRRSMSFDNSLPPRRRGAPSSPSITGSTPSACPPISAIRMPLGRRAASRTPLAGCAAPCRARPISPASTTRPSKAWSNATTTRRENALPSAPQPSSSQSSSKLLHFKRESIFPPARE